MMYAQRARQIAQKAQEKNKQKTPMVFRSYEDLYHVITDKAMDGEFELRAFLSTNDLRVDKMEKLGYKVKIVGETKDNRFLINEEHLPKACEEKFSKDFGVDGLLSNELNNLTFVKISWK